MAIKIDKAGKLMKVTPPSGSYFNLELLEQIVGGWPEPKKIGPLWVIQNEDAAKTPGNFNEVASIVFKEPIYGQVLSLSALELPPEWDLCDDFDTQYTIDEIDSGFVKSCTTAAQADEFTAPYGTYESSDPFAPLYNQQLFDDLEQVEYFYNPNKPRREATSEDNFINFLRDAYDYILDSAEDDFEDFILYEDDMNIVRVKEEEDKVKTMNQVLDILIDDEEYEKCAELRDVLVQFQSKSNIR